MRKILVTGGAGFIGSHVLEKLRLHGFTDVTVLDSFVSGCRAHIPDGMRVVEMDVRDPQLSSFLAREHFKCVIHLAAQTQVPYSMEHPEEDADINIMGLLNLLEGCRKSGVSQIIFSSSAAVYGDNPHLPLKEEETVRPLSFYGLSKAVSESYIRLYCHEYSMDGMILRFANVYGERQGESGEGGVISIFAKKIARGEDLTVFGDGSQTRDFVYAGDIAEVIVRAIGEPGVHVLNVATNTRVSLNELIELFRKLTDHPFAVHYGPVRDGDICDSVLSNEALNKTLGFRQFTNLSEGLKKTLEDTLKHC
ncbi:MAG: NAD-dependent epimerase/dehydratase family protein [Acidaminococcus sp.]|jgi:UDP-glucose 4-epimerase|nr:NAD-dependent epimerase/dehydratase family protein [Acidaminococcus sp.]MCI2099429.1 NAD-dependent epimerase/dehydratase family protein [Acidaminococcus sp.]MCI2113789.1 NAD-dependent epimerase/dehydratase family protein [Acidaminococcus sp.]MCI2115637.1 NAD-dependent epimerase/dehydratase family protein [Acidaminococcus sp.]